MARKKIADEIAGEVIYRSDRTCCVCQDKSGVHIHHVNSNSSDNVWDNLAYLCFSCHDDATKTSSLSRKLSAATIRKYRDEWYEIVDLKRKARKLLSIFQHITSLPKTYL